MGHYPFTLFNGLTLLVLILAILIAGWRFRRPLDSNWPLVFYAAIIGHTIVFAYGLNPYGVAAGAFCALAIRFGIYPTRVRFMELAPLAYLAWRAVGLILMW